MSRNHATATGFSLMEVLVAVAILGAIMSMVWFSFSKTIEAKEYAEGIQDRYHIVRNAMNRMSRELSMAYLSKHQDIVEKRTNTWFKGERRTPVDDLTFSSLAGLRYRKDDNVSEQTIIGYYGEASRDDPSRINLMRKEKTSLFTSPDDDDGYKTYVLAYNVERVAFEYFDPAQNDWADSWDTQGVEKSWRLPTMIKITMTVINEDGEEETFVTKTRVALPDPLHFAN